MKIDLCGNWNLITEDFGTFEAKVPGSVLYELVTKKLIEDPFYGRNETDTIPYLKKDYTYYRTFNLSSSDLKRHNYLFFESIDTIADIYINGTLIFRNMDMHMRERILLDNHILKEMNEIRIEFKSALNYVENYNGDYLFYSLGECVKKSPVLRKAHYMFGWDWGPNLPDMGIYRDIYIESTDMGYLDSFRDEISFKNDECEVYVATDSVKYGNIKVSVSLSGYGYEETKEASSSDNKDEFCFTVRNPEKWYPLGYGSQPLYDLKITLEGKNEKKEYSYKLGLRKITVDDSLDEYGKRLTILCNDIPVYLKGSDYIPMDNIIPRVKEENIDRLLYLAKSFNHNVIRIWGGGYYPDDYFYEKCDEMGILLWQDLMFACAVYDINCKEFADLIKAETEDVLKRIRHHASIMFICGNNENETGIEYWNPPRRDYAMETYAVQYGVLLRNAVKDNSSFYYLESSPTSGIERFHDSNNYNYMDMHYWDVWHGYKPFEAYKTIYPRLLSEFGCQSFPPMETVKEYAKEEDYDIFSPVMMQHQKNRTCNDKILGYVNSLYREAKDFESLVYLSMLSQAEGIKMCVEHLRDNRPRCHGVLFWQINDCWPGQSWSSMDYFFRLKALHYYSKKFYNDSLVIINEENNKIRISVSNDALISKSYKLLYAVYSTDGKNMLKEKYEIKVDKASRKDVLITDSPISEMNEKDTVVYAAIYENDEKVSENFYTRVKPKDLMLFEPELEVEFLDSKTIMISADVYAKNVYIEDTRSKLLSDNYFDLLPGMGKIVKFEEDIDEENLDIRTLFDAMK